MIYLVSKAFTQGCSTLYIESSVQHVLMI
jgi:hypothetical protein